MHAQTNTFIKQIIIQKSQKAELLTEVKRQRFDCKFMCSSYVAECFSRNTYVVRLKLFFSAEKKKIFLNV